MVSVVAQRGGAALRRHHSALLLLRSIPRAQAGGGRSLGRMWSHLTMEERMAWWG